MIRGNTKFDSLAVGEFTCSFLGPILKLECKAAFVSTKSGETHGWTTNHQWSPAVIEKLRELRALMEIDLGQIHLDGGGEMVAQVGTRAEAVGIEPSGLGERFTDPQV